MTALYEEQFSPAHDFPGGGEPTRYYAIASTPRCGSHALGHTLFQTGTLGFPLEYFNPVNFPRWSERFGTEGFHETYASIRAHRTSPNGCFGTKLHFGHFERLTGRHAFDSLFPGVKFVLLEREDLLGQAVSLAKARQTGAWISAQASQRAPSYSRTDIDRALEDLLVATTSWRLVLARQGWPYIRVSYEDFLEDPGRVIKRIADFVGVALDEGTEKDVRLPSRQRDDTSRRWRARYLSEARPSATAFDVAIELPGSSPRGKARAPGPVALPRRLLRRLRSMLNAAPTS